MWQPRVGQSPLPATIEVILRAYREPCSVDGAEQGVAASHDHDSQSVTSSDRMEERMSVFFRLDRYALVYLGYRPVRIG